MSLILQNNSKPDGIGVKTYPEDLAVNRLLGTSGQMIYFGSIGVSMSEFFGAVERVILGSTLGDRRDPARIFVERASTAEVGEGWEAGNQAYRISSETDYTSTVGTDPALQFGTYELSRLDLFIVAEYVLTNTDLFGKEDPRPVFVNAIKSINAATNPDGDKFQMPEGATLVSATFPPRPEFAAAPRIHWIGDAAPSEGIWE